MPDVNVGDPRRGEQLLVALVKSVNRLTKAVLDLADVVGEAVDAQTDETAPVRNVLGAIGDGVRRVLKGGRRS